MDSYLTVLKKYAVFTGRSRRKEYWMFILINFIISFVLGLILGLIHLPGSVSYLYSLAVFIPQLAVGTRRLHDTNRSGWWQLLWFIPVIGWIILIVWFATDSQAGNNAYGPNPKGTSAPTPTTPITPTAAI